MSFLKYTEDGSRPYFKRTSLGRPHRPDEISAALIDRFITSEYAQRTTLAAFVQAHREAATRGTLMALHRRHIVSWYFIQKFLAFCATLSLERNLQLRKAVWFNCASMAEHLRIEGPLGKVCDGITEHSQNASSTMAAVAQAHRPNLGNAASAQPMGVNLRGRNSPISYDSYSDELEQLAKHACWQDNNVWIGPSQGNTGTDVDVGDESIMDLAQGTPTRSMAVTTTYDALCGAMAGMGFS